MNSHDHDRPALPCSAPDIAARVFKQDRRVLLYGPPGAGKSTLAAQLARELAAGGQAVRTGHLTARACGEIAMAAEVARLVPFHFSRRYADGPQQIYDEVRAACSRLLIPKSMQLFGRAEAKVSETVLALD